MPGDGGRAGLLRALSRARSWWRDAATDGPARSATRPLRSASRMTARSPAPQLAHRHAAASSTLRAVSARVRVASAQLPVRCKLAPAACGHTEAPNDRSSTRRVPFCRPVAVSLQVAERTRCTPPSTPLPARNTALDRSLDRRSAPMTVQLRSSMTFSRPDLDRSCARRKVFLDAPKALLKSRAARSASSSPSCLT